jgi:hypothetical protein
VPAVFDVTHRPLSLKRCEESNIVRGCDILALPNASTATPEGLATIGLLEFTMFPFSSANMTTSYRVDILGSND